MLQAKLRPIWRWFDVPPVLMMLRALPQESFPEMKDHQYQQQIPYQRWPWCGRWLWWNLIT
jgi:hypothetical protein